MDLKYSVFISVTHTMLSTLVSKALLGEDLKYCFVISAANHRYWEIEHQCKWFSVLFGVGQVDFSSVPVILVLCIFICGDLTLSFAIWC